MKRVLFYGFGLCVIAAASFALWLACDYCKQCGSCSTPAVVARPPITPDESKCGEMATIILAKLRDSSIKWQTFSGRTLANSDQYFTIHLEADFMVWVGSDNITEYLSDSDRAAILAVAKPMVERMEAARLEARRVEIIKQLKGSK